ncbi:MAG: insulinase family protein [Saprospiraceae bacterium]|nr:insulinase family protein [Candidatus Brachybacter algidus]
MAIILSGDLDPDETIVLIDKYFGNMPAKTAPAFTYQDEDEVDTVTKITVYSPDEEKVAIGYKFPNALDKESVIAELVSAILYNGKSGLIDKDLIIDQKNIGRLRIYLSIERPRNLLVARKTTGWTDS